MEYEAYRRAWAERWQAEARSAQERARQVTETLPTLVGILVDEYGATGVALIGSLARGDFHASSDIDLVVAGVPAARFYEAGSALERASGLDVDLVPWETATDEMREVVSSEGRVLHGRL